MCQKPPLGLFVKHVNYIVLNPGKLNDSSIRGEIILRSDGNHMRVLPDYSVDCHIFMNKLNSAITSLLIVQTSLYLYICLSLSPHN